MTLSTAEHLTTIDVTQQADLQNLVNEITKLTDNVDDNDNLDVSEALSDGLREYLKANIEVANSIMDAINSLPEAQRTNQGIQQINEFLKEIIPLNVGSTLNGANTENIVFTEAQLQQKDAFAKMKDLIMGGKYEDFSDISKDELKKIQSFISDPINKQEVYATYFSMIYEHPIAITTEHIGGKDKKRYKAIKEAFEGLCNVKNTEYINYELDKVFADAQYCMSFTKHILKIENWDGKDISPENPQVEEFQKKYLFDGKQLADKFNEMNHNRIESNRKTVTDMTFDFSDIEGLKLQDDKLMLNDQELTKENLYEQLNLLGKVKTRLDPSFDTYFVSDEEVKESFTEEKLQNIYDALKQLKQDEVSAAIEASKPEDLKEADGINFFSGLKKENIIAAFNTALENVGQDQQKIDLLNKLKAGLSNTWTNDKNNEAYKAMVEVQTEFGFTNPDGKFGRNTFNKFVEYFNIYDKPEKIKAEDIKVTLYSGLKKEDVMKVFNLVLEKVENENEANILSLLSACLKGTDVDAVKEFQKALTGKDGDGKLGINTIRELLKYFNASINLSVDNIKHNYKEIVENYIRDNNLSPITYIQATEVYLLNDFEDHLSVKIPNVPGSTEKTQLYVGNEGGTYTGMYYIDYNRGTLVKLYHTATQQNNGTTKFRYSKFELAMGTKPYWIEKKNWERVVGEV